MTAFQMGLNQMFWIAVLLAVIVVLGIGFQALLNLASDSAADQVRKHGFWP